VRLADVQVSCVPLVPAVSGIGRSEWPPWRAYWSALSMPSLYVPACPL